MPCYCVLLMMLHGEMMLDVVLDGNTNLNKILKHNIIINEASIGYQFENYLSRTVAVGCVSKTTFSLS